MNHHRIELPQNEFCIFMTAMRKQLISVLLTLIGFHIPLEGRAALEFRWLGNTGFLLSDGERTLLFDPAVTSTPLHRWVLPFLGVKSDPDELDYWMKRCGVNQLAATFVNHTHTDHAIDAPSATLRYGGIVAGSHSLKQIALGHGVPEERIRVLRDREIVQVGRFEIQAIVTPHSPHFMNITLAEGHIDHPLKPGSNPWLYRVGEMLSYSISHPEGRVLFQAPGRVLTPDVLADFKPDTLLLTIANRTSSRDLIQQRILTSGAQLTIPLHWDNFFLPMNRTGKPRPLWFQNVDEFRETAQKLAPNAPLLWPEYCTPLSLPTRVTQRRGNPPPSL